MISLDLGFFGCVATDFSIWVILVESLSPTGTSPKLANLKMSALLQQIPCLYVGMKSGRFWHVRISNYLLYLILRHLPITPSIII